MPAGKRAWQAKKPTLHSRCAALHTVGAEVRRPGGGRFEGLRGLDLVKHPVHVQAGGIEPERREAAGDLSELAFIGGELD